jgi:RNA polymerase sigma factor (sigma-70 family)
MLYRFPQIVRIEPEMVRATESRSPHSSELQNRRDRGENLVEQDIALLNRFANDSNLNRAARKRARLAAETLKRLLSDSNSMANAAKATGVDSWCRRLKDADLAQLVPEALAGRRSVLYQALSKIAASHHECCDLPSEIRVLELAKWLFDLVCVALADELGRRQKRKEKPDGQLIRRILVEEEVRGELIHEVAKQRTQGLWFPGDRTDGREDAASEMAARIWELVADFSHTAPPAADPLALTAFMTGRFNRVLGRARDNVRTKIETSGRRTKKQAMSSADDEGDVLIQLVEQRPSESQPAEAWDRTILVEQLLSRAGLSEEEGRILELSYNSEKTQQEIAVSLGVTQGHVSKILDKAHQKLLSVSSPRDGNT